MTDPQLWTIHRLATFLGLDADICQHEVRIGELGLSFTLDGGRVFAEIDGQTPVEIGDLNGVYHALTIASHARHSCWWVEMYDVGA